MGSPRSARRVRRKRPPTTHSPIPLTRKQRLLLKEVQEFATLVNLDHGNILDYEPETRPTYLGLMKIRMVRGEVVIKYSLVDEYLSAIICNYFFRRKQRRSTFRRLWKTNRFRIFNHHVLDELYVLQKMRLVDAISPLPSDVKKAINRINALRNDLAHSFFPENRRHHMSNKKVTYDDVDIHTREGLERFLEDFARIRDCLEQRAFL
jgi:hypothetical protein